MYNIKSQKIIEILYGLIILQNTFQIYSEADHHEHGVPESPRQASPRDMPRVNVAVALVAETEGQEFAASVPRPRYDRPAEVAVTAPDVAPAKSSFRNYNNILTT